MGTLVKDPILFNGEAESDSLSHHIIVYVFSLGYSAIKIDLLMFSTVLLFTKTTQQMATSVNMKYFS